MKPTKYCYRINTMNSGIWRRRNGPWIEIGEWFETRPQWTGCVIWNTSTVHQYGKNVWLRYCGLYREQDWDKSTVDRDVCSEQGVWFWTSPQWAYNGQVLVMWFCGLYSAQVMKLGTLSQWTNGGCVLKKSNLDHAHSGHVSDTVNVAYIVLWKGC